MGRLTNKNSLKILNELSQKNTITSEQFLIYNKLGQLEDIEEELGISLVVFFQALNQEEVYVKLPNGRIDKCSFLVEKLGENVFGFSYPIHEDWIYYYLKDYGKTWALTKEALENVKSKSSYSR